MLSKPSAQTSCRIKLDAISFVIVFSQTLSKIVADIVEIATTFEKLNASTEAQDYWTKVKVSSDGDTFL